MPVTDLYQLAADKIGCQKADIANLNLYPGGRVIVKLKFGKIYAFQAIPKSGTTLVPPGKPFHIHDASGIDFTGEGTIDPAVCFLGRLITVQPNSRPVFGLGGQTAGNNEAAAATESGLRQGGSASYPGTKLTEIPLVTKSQVIKTMAGIRAAADFQAAGERETAPVVHGQTAETSPQNGSAQQAVVTARSRRSKPAQATAADASTDRSPA